MKKVTTGLILALISIQSFACRLDSLGYCRNEAYFKTNNFDNSVEVQIRLLGSSVNLYDFNTRGDGNTDTVFTVTQSSQLNTVKIQFRYKPIGTSDNHYTTWGDYAGDGKDYIESSTKDYPGCGTLAVTLKSMQVQRIDADNINVSFETDLTNDVSNYIISVSEKQSEWKNISSIKYDPTTTTYNSGSLNLYAAGLSFGLLLLPFFSRKRNIFLPILLSILIIYSCKKDMVTTEKTKYNFVKVTPISKDGIAGKYIISPIKP